MALPLPFDTQGLPVVNAIVQGGGGGITVDVGADPQSQPAPDPRAINDPTAVSLTAEPDHALRTRARVLTDEGAFADDFTGASLYTAVVGNVTLTNASTVWSRAVATTPLRVGDYIELVADHNDAVPVMAQIDTITAGGLSGTLLTAYAGAGGTGAAQTSCYLVTIVGAGAGIAVAVSSVALQPALANGARTSLMRNLAVGGHKGCVPLRVRFNRTDLSARRANQGWVFGLFNADPFAGGDHGAWFELDGGDADTLVNCTAATSIAAADTLLQQVAIPAAGNAIDPHIYELVLYQDRVAFEIDGMPAFDAPYHVPLPYQGLQLVLFGVNNNAMGGATTLGFDDVRVENVDSVEVVAFQQDPVKLQMSAHDQTVFAGSYMPPAVVNVADDLAHQVCTAMELGHGYAVTQIGGADLQALIVAPAAGAPAVATIRLSPYHLFNGIPWVFRPRILGEQLYVAKAVNGTANATVYHDSVDGGNGA